MKQLQMQYLSADAKKRLLTVGDVKQDLDAATVQAQMAAIAASKLFMVDGQEIYQQPVAAAYVERIVTPIFNNDVTAEK